MQFGLILSQFGTKWKYVESDARRADELGLDSVWLADHLLAPARDDLGVFEAWTSLGYLAAITKGVRLGQAVNCVAFRNVGLFAKMATTLDHASAGRLDLGLGAGWMKREYEAFGYRFPSPGDRRRYFEEYLDALDLLFSGGPVAYEGRFIHLDEAHLSPGPLQQPRPPIMIGTGGRLMSVVAGRRADVWNCPARYLPRLDEVRERVMEAADGREVATTIQVPVAVGRTEEEARMARDVAKGPSLAWMGDIEDIGVFGTVDEATEQVKRYAERGVDGLIAGLPGSPARPGFIEAYAELAARF